MQKKKTLVLVTNKDYMALEEAQVKENEGFEIFFVLCDKSIGVCHPNSYCSGMMCRFCKYTMLKLIKPLLRNSNYHCISLSSLITIEDISYAERMTFDYSSVEELKSITFHGVEIGYGAFSTYVSASRNVMPDFTPELISYLNFMMRSEVKMTLALERYINDIKPSLIVLHNGRFSNVKAPLWIAKQNKIDYLTTETRCTEDGTMLKDFFYNDIPHSFKALKDKTELAWAKCGAEKGRKVGHMFFENRKNSKPAGDKVYTKLQSKGKLPDNFDESKRNIAIFNSSEDEYFSISKEFDESVLFPNQYEALRTIFEHYKNDNGIHFYLRIHPNLAAIPYKSHTLLYELKYNNVTIIPPKSDVNSYALMESSEKVIVFGSTIGMESSYWGKPVIALGKDFYSSYNIVHQPETKEQVFSMIDSRDLKCLRDDDSCNKLACFIMGLGTDSFIFYNVTSKVDHFLGKPINTYSCFKVFGSPKLHRIVELTMMCLSILGSKSRSIYKILSY